ncbi:MAG: iron chelate uptake ABC transporter family permease subunit [Propionicimonas sp.]
MSTAPLDRAGLGWPANLRPVRVRTLSGLVDLRAAGWTALVGLVALAVGFYSLTVGTAGIGVDQVLAAFAGTADTATSRIVLEWRASRVAFALLGGAALAIGGAVFQSITRNPLGSPDIVGFSTGAYTGALLVALFGVTGSLATSLGALAGGLATGLAVYALAYRRGVTGSRVIVVGIGASLFLGAFNTWVLTTMKLEQAISAASWGAGSLNDVGWVHVLPLAAGLVLALPVVLVLSADMRVLELGDDAGRGLGVRAELVRAVLLLLGIALVALVTASAGPIAFVALAAPQLALRVTRTPGVRILPAAAFGSLLLVVSDLIARTVIAPAQLPVGVVTLCLGGAYLVWLLAGFGRRTRL